MRQQAANRTTAARVVPDGVQLLFVDLQTSLVATSDTTTPERIERSATVLAKIATILKLPLLFSTVAEGKSPPTLLKSLQPYSTEANTLQRVPAGALMDEATAKVLKEAGRPTIVIAGFATEVAVLQATLDAIMAGYVVYYVVDATGSAFARTEEAAFREMEQAGAVPMSVLSLATRMTPDFTSTPGSDVFEALQPLLKA